MEMSSAEKYRTSCAALGITPNSFIVQRLEEELLYIKATKLQPEEWKPVIKCLEKNSMLLEVIVEAIIPPQSTFVKGTTSPSFTLAVKNQLIKSLASCLKCSSVIKKLSIVCVPLKKTQLEYLSHGLSRNHSIEFLCLKGSVSGPQGFNEIFPAVRKSLNLTHVDFSLCKLSGESCSLIGALLRSQTLERHTQTWKHTLRYNNPDISTANGLKRITLNGNPIGDDGCEIITTALQDDYWIKGLDLQQCDITNEGAKMFLMMLEDNASISVLDLRLNAKITDDKLLNKVNELLERNRQLNTEHFDNGDLFVKAKKAVRTKKAPRRSISNINLRNSLNESRTHKKMTLHENYYNSVLKKSVAKNIEHMNDMSQKSDKDKFSPILIHHLPPKTRGSSTKCNEERQMFAMLDELKDDLEVYKKELYLEKEKTKNLEKKLNSLERENMFLKSQHHEQSRELEPELLETIETSFSQFHNFLDMLKQAGYGDLCQLMNK